MTSGDLFWPIWVWFPLPCKRNFWETWKILILFPFLLQQIRKTTVELSDQNETLTTLLLILLVSQKVNNTNQIPCKSLKNLKRVQSNSRLAEEFWTVNHFANKWINSSRLDPGKIILTALRSNVEGSALGNNTDYLPLRHSLVCFKILSLLQTF